jgi:hypothetical protein
MKASHVLDELSEYIDGVSPHPDRIARHLQSCPECARRHLELLKLSSHLRALPAPEMDGAFVARVMARVEDQPARLPWLQRSPVRFLAAACTVAAAVAAGLWLHPGLSDAPVPAVPALNTAWQDDEQVVEAFARLMDAGVALDLFGDVDSAAEDDALEVVPVDRFLATLADGASETGYDSWDSDEISALLDAAGELDEQALGELLETWKSEV